MNFNKLVLLIVMFFTGYMAYAQGTVDDYNRAYSMQDKYSNQVFYSNITPHWINSSHIFWYSCKTPDGYQYLVVNADKKTKTILFDNQKLASAISKNIKENAGTTFQKKVNSKALYLKNLKVNTDLDTCHFVYNNTNWTYIISTDILTNDGLVPTPNKPRNWTGFDTEKDWQPITSPNGHYQTYMKDNNVYIKELSTNKETQITTDGTENCYYSAYIKWSPDSKKLATYKIRSVQQRYVYYVESSPKDQLQPKLHKQPYTKPGDVLPFKIPHIFNIETGKVIIPETDLFAQQYDLGGLDWTADSKTITFEYNQRGHQVYRVLEISANTGTVRTIVEETNPKYVNYTRHFRYDLPKTHEMIWMSERDNWNHLYMYDYHTGKVKYQITKGQWYVRSVVKVDEDAKQIYFTANGMIPANLKLDSKVAKSSAIDSDQTSKVYQDPYLIYYYRIDFDGKHLTCLTPEAGMHKAWFSEDMKYLVDYYSYVNKAPITELRKVKNSKKLMTVEKADISRLVKAGWKAPEVFVAKGRDGKTDMWGLITRPTNFDPNKTYPIIEYIYQGPGNQYVPKTFIEYNRYFTSITELGFIIVQIDGMSTSFRSRDFENVCYHNLKDAGLPDHMLWIKAAANKYKYLDVNTVGIYGCSAGGQESTNAVLLHPDFYKAAYSACGCHDNRMDKIWWNELWMGYPIGDQYKESSNVENAHLLQVPLMLVVGELDNNVDPSSTMQVVNALEKANKEFELVIIPGAQHTVGGPYGLHKRYDFFVRNLMHKTPPKWSEVKSN
ncbi:MAG: DPP IV N-terminal domain-containing protein [Bacteroidales bacterium]